ncbi:MAG TPA: hypothetical protein PLX03_07700, partial [Candidatus Hydrogenedentes bacterium]|nr:hypothetical protein [Candidatus Hydrogenedentota bacterium]
SLLASLLTATYLVPLLASRKPASLSGARGSVWLLRAWQESRNAGRGIAGSFLWIPLLGARYAVRAVAAIMADLVGPSWNTLLNIFRAPLSKTFWPDY